MASIFLLQRGLLYIDVEKKRVITNLLRDVVRSCKDLLLLCLSMFKLVDGLNVFRQH